MASLANARHREVWLAPAIHRSKVKGVPVPSSVLGMWDVRGRGEARKFTQTDPPPYCHKARTLNDWGLAMVELHFSGLVMLQICDEYWRWMKTEHERGVQEQSSNSSCLFNIGRSYIYRLMTTRQSYWRPLFNTHTKVGSLITMCVCVAT
jgi:hypothetical protein